MDETPQDHDEPAAGSGDLKMPEVSARKPNLHFFQRGLPRPDDAPAPAIVPKRTQNELRAMREDRREKAYDLWLKQIPTREIGRRLGCSHNTIMRAIEAYRLVVEKHGAQNVAQTRHWLVQQHQRVQRDAWEKTAQTGPVGVMALAEITKSLAEVAKLTGAHSPVKVASTNPDGTSWAPISVALSQIPTDDLKVLRKYHERKVLNGAEAVDAQIIDAEPVVVNGENSLGKMAPVHRMERTDV